MLAGMFKPSPIFLRAFKTVLKTSPIFAQGSAAPCSSFSTSLLRIPNGSQVKSQITLVSPSSVYSFPVRFYGSEVTVKKQVPGIHENISALQIKTRTQRRRSQKVEIPNKGWSVVAYSTAEEYDLEKLKDQIEEQKVYALVENKTDNEYTVQDTGDTLDDVLHVVARYSVEDEPREMFFFREGTAVLWNVSQLEAANVLRFVRPCEINSYDRELVLSEKESMVYTHAERHKTDLVGGMIVLDVTGEKNMEKYTFSNAIALSVKLGIWESSLDRYVDSIAFITEDLKLGRKILMSRDEVLRKQGELFALRHLINLSSDLLDTPDFYWDNEELENLYMKTVGYFSINRRTRVMNEKLNHCLELIELVSSHLSDKHHVRLEWMIIILIMVEVAFEMLHFIHH